MVSIKAMIGKTGGSSSSSSSSTSAATTTNTTNLQPQIQLQTQQQHQQQLPTQKQTQPQTTTAVVSFGDAPCIQTIERPSEEEKHTIWYVEDDYAYMKTREKLMVRLFKTGCFQESNQRTLRGLEHLLLESVIQERRSRASRAVLDEQNRQQQLGVSQPLELSHVYSAVTSNSQKIALMIGQQDADAANIVTDPINDPLCSHSAHETFSFQQDVPVDVLRATTDAHETKSNQSPVAIKDADDSVPLSTVSDHTVRPSSSSTSSTVSTTAAACQNRNKQRTDVSTELQRAQSEVYVRSSGGISTTATITDAAAATPDKATTKNPRTTPKQSSLRGMFKTWSSRRLKKSHSKKGSWRGATAAATTTAGNSNGRSASQNPNNSNNNINNSTATRMMDRTQSCATVMEIQFEPDDTLSPQTFHKPRLLPFASWKKNKRNAASSQRKLAAASARATTSFAPIQEIEFNPHEEKTTSTTTPTIPKQQEQPQQATQQQSRPHLGRKVSSRSKKAADSMRDLFRTWSSKRLARKDASTRTCVTAMTLRTPTAVTHRHEITFDPRRGSSTTSSTAETSDIGSAANDQQQNQQQQRKQQRSRSTSKRGLFRGALRSWSSRRLTKFRLKTVSTSDLQSDVATNTTMTTPTAVCNTKWSSNLGTIVQQDIDFVPEEEEVSKDFESTRFEV